MKRIAVLLLSLLASCGMPEFVGAHPHSSQLENPSLIGSPTASPLI